MSDQSLVQVIVLLVSPDQNLESFLGEMVIRCQHFYKIPASHSFHRDAVGQAVAFVKARFVENYSSIENLPSLRWDDCTSVDASNRLNGQSAHLLTVFTEEIHKL